MAGSPGSRDFGTFLFGLPLKLISFVLIDFPCCAIFYVFFFKNTYKIAFLMYFVPKNDPIEATILMKVRENL